MPFKRLLILPVLLLPGLISCGNAQNKTFQLKGKLDKHPNTWIYLEHVNGSAIEKVDSAKTNKAGEFLFEKKVAEKDFYRLKASASNQVSIILDPKEQVEYFNEGVSLQEKYKLSGSKEGELILEIKALKNKTSQFGDSLNRLFGTFSQEQQQEMLPKLQATYENFMKVQSATLLQLIDKHKDKLAILTTAELIDPETDFASYDQLGQYLAKYYPHSTSAMQVSKKAEQLKKSAIGQLAPEIDLPNPEGKNIALSSLKGKVVLIDFWASWCGPCRRENPNVVKAYQKYKDKGFDVYSVSLDKDKSSWVDAIKKDGLVWPNHVSDLAFWSSSVVPQYGFSGIPFTVLIDREGKIVAKGLRGEKLEEKLEMLLNR